MKNESKERNLADEELEEVRGSGLSVSSGAKLAVAETFQSSQVAAGNGSFSG